MHVEHEGSVEGSKDGESDVGWPRLAREVSKENKLGEGTITPSDQEVGAAAADLLLEKKGISCWQQLASAWLDMLIVNW
jgi:hypothetical protein